MAKPARDGAEIVVVLIWLCNLARAGHARVREDCGRGGLMR